MVSRFARDRADLSGLRSAGNPLEDLSQTGATANEGFRNCLANLGWVYWTGTARAGGRVHSPLSYSASHRPSLFFAAGGVGRRTDLRHRSVRRSDGVGDFSAERASIHSPSRLLPAISTSWVHSYRACCGNRNCSGLYRPERRKRRALGGIAILTPFVESRAQAGITGT